MSKLFPVFIFFLISCGKPAAKQAAPPGDLIPENKMVQVLTEVHLLEGALQLRAPRTITSPPGMNNPPEAVNPNVPAGDTLPYVDIFKKFSVTHAQYERSMKWYSANPQQLSKIYDEVLSELDRRQTAELSVKSDTMKKKKPLRGNH